MNLEKLLSGNQVVSFASLDTEVSSFCDGLIHEMPKEDIVKNKGELHMVVDGMIKSAKLMLGNTNYDLEVESSFARSVIHFENYRDEITKSDGKVFICVFYR